jgi:hypothetical protein
MVTLILKPDKETLQFPVFDPLHIFDIFWCTYICRYCVLKKVMPASQSTRAYPTILSHITRYICIALKNNCTKTSIVLCKKFEFVKTEKAYKSIIGKNISAVCSKTCCVSRIGSRLKIFCSIFKTWTTKTVEVLICFDICICSEIMRKNVPKTKLNKKNFNCPSSMK